ncbi:hypothetical protein O6H91_06G106100 [Diphasiastrum complanatum]|uniref:Uncharacterized protein n=1 Tax=Diphasiastrum complanatum TaxID=34168 RepID=A0ACC2DHJ3_DIPCM|nr:hypothetical protein O6H91_06G106100 [Diphasiastrum complanatum]
MLQVSLHATCASLQYCCLLHIHATFSLFDHFLISTTFTSPTLIYNTLLHVLHFSLFLRHNDKIFAHTSMLAVSCRAHPSPHLSGCCFSYCSYFFCCALAFNNVHLSNFNQSLSQLSPLLVLILIVGPNHNLRKHSFAHNDHSATIHLYL